MCLSILIFKKCALPLLALKSFWMANVSYTYVFLYNNIACIRKKKCIFIFQVTENVEYDQKVGFIIRSPSVRDSGEFICEAIKNDISESVQLNVFVNRELVFLLTRCVDVECRNCFTIEIYYKLKFIFNLVLTFFFSFNY